MDISFSMDENGNSTFMNIKHSTPKKVPINVLVCNVCDKEYRSKFYFKKHVDSHNIEDSSKVNESSIFLDVSQISFSEVAGKKVTNPSPTFKKPMKPTKKKKKGVLRCTYCLKDYVCSKAFKNHLRAHAIQDAAARYPTKDGILMNVECISQASLVKLSNSPVAACASGDKYRQFLGYVISISGSEKWKKFAEVLCVQLISGIVGKKFLLPSALLSSLVDEAENVLTNVDFCRQLLSLLGASEEHSYNMQSVFLLRFTVIYCKEILAYISKTIRQSLSINKVQEIDEEDKQVIFYIGGSILRGYMRIAFRFKNNTMWQSISQAIKSSAIDETPSVIKDGKWTRSRDRGGLTHVNEQCQNFFIPLAKIVYSCERRDGSIDFEELQEKVVNSELCVLWDKIMFDSLKEDVSLNLMNDVVRCFAKTCGRGFAKKRLNALRSRPVISMPIRHKAASRKTK